MTFPIDKWELFHIFIGLGLVAANIGVYRGVKLEEEFVEWTKETGRRILIASLAWEAALAFLLLGVDSYVSVRQQSKIIALEKALTPRVVEQTDAPKALKPYSYMRVIVFSFPGDDEAKRTAGQIRALLLVSSWQKLSVLTRDPIVFFDGVVVHTAGFTGTGQSIEADNAAASALVTELRKDEIAARLGFPIPELGEHGIAVEVGRKPLPEFLQKKYEGKSYGNMMDE